MLLRRSNLCDKLQTNSVRGCVRMRLQGGRWMDRWMTSACCSMNTRSLEGLTIKMDCGLCAEISTARLFIVMFADEGNRTAWMGFVGFAHLGVASKAIERIVE